MPIRNHANAVPILKIGAVLVHPISREILIVRPHPKTLGEVPPFVLPRGSRQYQDDAGAWHDARDVETGTKHRDRLEPFARALAREIEEEAGVNADMLAAAKVTEIGAMDFQSRTKGVYPIHWFMVMPTQQDAAQLDKQTPVDATEICWASLDDIKALAAKGEFSPGYVSVIEAALYALHTSP
jgi:8-oxo-dGTP pyrophosphatase MutT (NUDIX family)